MAHGVVVSVPYSRWEVLGKVHWPGVVSAIAVTAQVGSAHLDSEEPGPLAAPPFPILSRCLRILRLPNACSQALLNENRNKARHARVTDGGLLLWGAVTEWADLFPGCG